MEHETSNGLPVLREGAAVPAGGILVALLLGLAGSAWLLSARLATPDMRLGVLTGASMQSASSQMGMSRSMSTSVSVFVATWAVMMVAMMVPSVVSAVRAFEARARIRGQPGAAAGLFIAGYLVVWSAIGAVAYLVVQALQDWPVAGSMTVIQVGALVLVVAGVYQLTPPKQACLRHCRPPHTSVVPPVRARVPRHIDAVRAGLRQGAYCLGSSWPLMLVLLLVGMMNLVWMAVIAGVIFVEKEVPRGVVVGKAVGCGLAGWGIVLLAAPHASSGLVGV